MKRLLQFLTTFGKETGYGIWRKQCQQLRRVIEAKRRSQII